MQVQEAMQIKDLEIFENLPFNFWVKDEEGTYLWANKEITQLAGENVIGKNDHDLIWTDSIENFIEADKQVLESEKPLYRHEHSEKTNVGPVTVSVCKWPGELEGKKCCFGISFSVPE